MNDTSLTTVFSELNAAVVDGAKAGIAAELGEKITATLLKATGFELPAFLASGTGRKLLPVALCYGVVALTVMVPSFPKAAAVRKVCFFAAKGSITVLSKELSGTFSELAGVILGQAALYDVG